MVLPFGSAKNNLHAGLPWKGISFRDWAMKPLLQISIVYVLINKHPAPTKEKRPSNTIPLGCGLNHNYVYNCHDAPLGWARVCIQP